MGVALTQQPIPFRINFTNISSVKRQLSHQVLLTPDYLRNQSQDEGRILILPNPAKYAKFPLAEDYFFIFFCNAKKQRELFLIIIIAVIILTE